MPIPDQLKVQTTKADPTGMLGNIFRIAELTSAKIKDRKDWDPAFQRRAVSDLEAMAPIRPQDIIDFAVQKGWYKVDKKTGDLNSANLDGEEAGYVASVMKFAIEGMAGQTKILADSFLMKVANKQDATNEGLLLAQEMKGYVKDCGINSSVCARDRKRRQKLWHNQRRQHGARGYQSGRHGY